MSAKKEVLREIKDYENIQLQNKNIKIKSIKGYVKEKYKEMKELKIQKRKKELQIELYMKESSQFEKVFMGNIPLFLKEDEVRKIVEVFGILKQFQLIKDSKSNSRGFAFF